MSRPRVHLAMALAGALAGLVVGALYLPVFLVLGGHPGAFWSILLVDIGAVALVAGLCGGSLASPVLGGTSVVRRAARASVVTWLVLWGSLTLLGAVKAVTDGAMGMVASWLPGYLAYAAAYAVLGTPILVALIVQLCVASWVFRRLVDRAPAR